MAVLRPRGAHLEIELKRTGDRIRDDQFRHMNDVRRCGGWYILVSSFDDFLEQFEKIQKLIF